MTKKNNEGWELTDFAFLVGPLLLGIGVTRLVTPSVFTQCGNRPSIQPPGWAFGVAWTILYSLAGLALALVWRKDRNIKTPQMIALLCALGYMIAWWVVFSNICFPMIAFGALLVAVAGVTGATFVLWKTDNVISSLLLFPLIAWLIFASVLQYLTK
jgi:tryptophan-rich sensory protein